MRCERAQELFSEYCEGSIQTALRVPLEGHLDECDECRLQVADLRVIWRILDMAPIVEPPPGFRAAVWQRIEESEAAKAARKSRSSFNWRTLFTRPALGWSMAVLLVILMAGVVVPGRQMGASMGFPWSLFSPEIQTGAPVVAMDNGQTVVTIPIYGRSERRVFVRVEGMPTNTKVESSELLIGPGKKAEAHLRFTQPLTVKQVKLGIYEHRGDGYKTIDTQEVSLPAQ